jgi:RNA polymerase sigma factor (sigma-70 family)
MNGGGLGSDVITVITTGRPHTSLPGSDEAAPDAMTVSPDPSELPGPPAPADVPVTAAVPRRPPGRPDVPAPLDDAAVEATKRGERWAWEAAYLAYARALTGFLVLRLGDRDEAAEAVSETFLRALDRASSLRGGAESFRAWLFRIARNVAHDRLRARQRAGETAEPMADAADMLLADPDSDLIAAEDADLVRHALAGLDADDREILWLRVCARLSSAEVGEIVGKRAGAVRMQQQRALAALAKRMGLS